MKVQRTVDALNRGGVDARLLDPVRERLRDYDLVHVFAGYNGNNRIVEQAKSDGLPVVMSTILNPPFNKRQGQLARFLTRAVGRLTRWEITTTYRHLAVGMSLADHLIALGTAERSMLIEGYLISPDKISIIHNGIGEEFFHSDPKQFAIRFPHVPRPFVLHTGIIGDVKNQLGLVRALAGTGIDIVLIGYAGRAAKDYLAACVHEGKGKVHYLGELPHGALMASAYAAASLVAVPSRHEGMPNSILEALAADRPVVLTNNHTIDFDLPTEVAQEVASDDLRAIRDAVLRFMRQPPRSGVARAVVANMSWDSVASQLREVYLRVTPRCGGSNP
jgi:glycosyltransferase involved in cell wall biosynthesis